MADMNERLGFLQQLIVAGSSEDATLDPEYRKAFDTLTAEEKNFVNNQTKVQLARISAASQTDKIRAKSAADQAMAEIKGNQAIQKKITEADLARRRGLDATRADRSTFRLVRQEFPIEKVRSGELDSRLGEVEAATKALRPLATKDPGAAVWTGKMEFVANERLLRLAEESTKTAEKAAAERGVTLAPEHYDMISKETVAAKKPFHQQGGKLNLLLAQAEEAQAARNAEMMATQANKAGMKGGLVKGAVGGAAAALILPAILKAFGGGDKQPQGINPALMQAAMMQGGADSGSMSRQLMDLNRLLNAVKKIGELNAAVPQPVGPMSFV